MDIDGWLVTMDIQKAFDSVDHEFMFLTLERAGFGPSFMNWIKILVQNQESCVYNAGTSTGYFPLERGCRQGDPISAYLFILVIEVFFTMVRTNPSIEGLNILNFDYKLTSYADDSSFFLKNETSVVELLKTFDIFSKYSGLQLNKSKCEIAGIGSKRGVFAALCGLKNIDLTVDAIKILGIYFSYNKVIAKEKNYNSVVKKLTACLALWKWRNLSLAGKVTIFKSLGFSKFGFVALMATTPRMIIDKIKEMQVNFIWDNKRPKIAHLAFISSYEDGGLKDIDIDAKIRSLRLSWVTRLYSGSDHPWKHIPRTILERQLEHKPFFPNVSYTPSSILPNFYQSMVRHWIDVARSPP